MATMLLPAEAKYFEKCEERLISEPRLTQDACLASRLPVRKRGRHSQNLWETLLFTVTLMALLAFCLIGTIRSLSQISSASGQLPLTSTAVLPVTVHPGDTLWTYAQKYGASNTYILDRVETIARANHLSSEAALAPGQRLLIPVTNPIILARLENHQRLARL